MRDRKLYDRQLQLTPPNTGEEIKTTMNTTTDDLRVMASGAFTAAYLELIPRLELLTKKKIVTVTTSVGTGETSIANRLKRGEIVDIVIVADALLRQFIAERLVLAEGYTPVARSSIGAAGTIEKNGRQA